MQRTGPTEPRDGQRIAKLLARAGVASRREIERMIADGRIALNGRAIDTPATVLTSLSGVTVDGEPIEDAAPTRLFLFNKPSGVLTAAFDPKGRATIYDRLPRDLPRLMPVGRLDLATEGLLLMTTDGEFKRLLELPATGVERAYRARAYGAVTQAQLEDLIDGVEVDGVRYGAIDANLERRTGANVWIELVLTEGKNREVRRVLEHLGLRVSRLIRTRYGPFVLGELPVGAIGEVRHQDIIDFRASLKGNRAKAVEDARAAPIAVSGGPARSRGVPRRGAGDGEPPPQRDRAPRPSPPKTPRDATSAAGRARAPAPRKREVREDIETRVRDLRPARPSAGGEPKPRLAPPSAGGEPKSRPARPSAGGEPKPRPKRGVGWARAKPRPGAGKPKRPRR